MIAMPATADVVPLEPIRGELFGLEHLEQHAQAVARETGPGLVVPGRPLMDRFEYNAEALAAAHRAVSEAYRRGETLGTAADWLLDNFHIIREVLREVPTDLPAGYYRLLPKCADGERAGFPCVLVVAHELIRHCDSSLDEVKITRFVQAYQEVVPLRIGELWAVPIMLRLVLIENLRRLADLVIACRRERAAAETWAARWLPELAQKTETPPVALPDRFTDDFIVHVLELCREQPHGLVGVEAVEHCLAKLGTGTADILRRGQQRQAANQVSIGNCVTSLRLLAAIDWEAFFERTSQAEVILRQDPSGVYPRQDFVTRDRCRQVIEKLARRGSRSELEVARQAVALASRATGEATPERIEPDRLVAYYLLDKGRLELEGCVDYRPDLGERFTRSLLGHAPLIYLGGVATWTLLLTAGVVWLAGDASVAVRLLLALLVLLSVSELAIGIMNRLMLWLVPPRVLPKLHFRDGIAGECPTFVVIPSMLSNPDSARLLAERLESHYLANPDPQLRFALLTDFADAPQQTMPEDEDYVQAALAAVRKLNERHAGSGPDRFYLFHRRRQWNPSQGCWMGWERKRGKLCEFNRLLRGDHTTSYAVQSGHPDLLPRIRYVITLDADTQLPHESAQRLIATLAHPLNQPRLDPEQRRVVAGYGVLQPRVSFTLPGARQSLFARIFSGSVGLDPYTTAVSDVYQDLFGIGSFTGKGIYDIDAFEAAVGERFPDNQILSHDLIEGNFARCGLVTDIEFLDDFPARYHAYARREHRWIRGDWQILPWLFPWTPTRSGRRERNPLPAIERWKIFDNLRRSLLAPSLVLVLALGWTVLPGSAWLWTDLVGLVLLWPLLLHGLGLLNQALACWRRGRDPRTLPGELLPTAGQVGLAVVLLADQARHALDAVGRTLFRLLVSRRHTLEWETAASTERRLGADFADFVHFMWPASLLAVGLALLVGLVNPPAWPLALPFLLGWLVSPWVAYRVSRPRKIVRPVLLPEDRRQLHMLARRTWGFFEEFVTAEDHWLPPDNYQEDPKDIVAHRTSPTNIGLYLLATLSAHDFGYLGIDGLLDRLEKSFDTLDRLDRSHGHFYNWYATDDLRPLQPVYLSTVDSGNLAACLLTLHHGLRELASEPHPGPQVARGLQDTLAIIETEHAALASGTPPALEALRRHLEAFPRRRDQLDTWLAHLELQAAAWLDHVRERADCHEQECLELLHWSMALVQQAGELAQEAARPREDADKRAGRLQRLAERARELARQMDFRILYNQSCDLFSVGFNLTQGRLDNAHYDLLASEAALTSFLAVARGDVPTRHWFKLSRPLTRTPGGVGLLSWGGTMFEYLMPRLLLRCLPDTLLEASQQVAVARQIAYGQERGVPWGISESAFSAVDAELNYQYQAFGVPGLGLKRGLGKELVVAPYATALAVPLRPTEAAANLRRLTEQGGAGRYGYYEAIDYTPERLPPQRRHVVVKCFMAHHQGMSLVALANCLLNEPMPRRLHAEPMVRATELLLQERLSPAAPLVEPQGDEPALPAGGEPEFFLVSRRLHTPHTAHPRTHLLSNGHYSTMMTNAGGGRSWCRDLDVTRWREDRTCDSWGSFLYIKDLRNGAVWSAGHQPTGKPADEYEVTYSTDKVEIRRRDGQVESRLEVVVTPEDQAEVRRLTLTNHGRKSLYLEVTSYNEVVLAKHGDDLTHPAFQKLFLETELVAGEDALLCRRRPRAAEQQPVWAMHVLAVEGETVGPLQYETDRGRFLGRGRTTANPWALDPQGPAKLSGTLGTVLDPVLCLRRQVRVPRDASVSLAFTLAVAGSREAALAMADEYHDYSNVTRAFEMAWAHSQVELRHLHITPEESHLYQRLAAHVFYASPLFRAAPTMLASNRQGQAGLWRHGISGDLPIVLVTVTGTEHFALVRQVMEAHAFWGLKGLKTDLVILNDRPGGYFDEVQPQLMNLLQNSEARLTLDKPGGVFVRRTALLNADERVLLRTAARCVLVGGRGSLGSQVERLERGGVARLPLPPQSPTEIVPDAPPPAPRSDLQFANGTGGFTPDGREYIITLSDGQQTPAPWSNVIANPSFGFMVSEQGCGSTWAGNSQTNRLTPWHNDPVSDPPGELIYLRDEETGEFWTATPFPRRPAAFEVRHGQGYSVFTHSEQMLRHELTLLADPEDPVKLYRLRLGNPGPRGRRLGVTFYVEWVLGTQRDQAGMFLVTERDADSGALLARNAYHPDCPDRVAFIAADVEVRDCTGDRTEFLGRNGTLAQPAAVGRGALGGTVGAGLDACGALLVELDLPAGSEREVVFYLGQAESVEEVRHLLARHRQPGQAEQTLAAVCRQWDDILGAVQVHTPNRALDLLVNRWLLYQVLSCRYWGRSAFYQSGGAYGFRDQLQDVLALLWSRSALAREHLLRAAGRQFPEGDVQHWWHPPSGAGVRTRFSDDFLWLPFAVAHYVRVSGDTAILDETVPFLDAALLRPDQEEDYGIPAESAEAASLYEHCLRAIRNGLKVGRHGLPLMGTGDWNDGMNRVGAGGQGESVWNAWFLMTILRDFAALAEERNDDPAWLLVHAERLRQAVDTEAWDGRWYRRAYFDDGTPLGSADNDACRIDSIAQSWAVLSGAADPERARQALDAVEEHLVREAERLILLFTPPFDQTVLEPGYIKGYLPGIRENGGQYTHAAVWVPQAMALLGRHDRAMELLDLINPILHTTDPAGVQRYRIEPYVLAGDVYSQPPHVGRGGWSWYTGSAGWYYRVVLEVILGFELRGQRLTIRPRLPAHWPGYRLTFRHGAATYHVEVERTRQADNGAGHAAATEFTLQDDGQEHHLHIQVPPTFSRPLGLAQK